MEHSARPGERVSSFKLSDVEQNKLAYVDQSGAARQGGGTTLGFQAWDGEDYSEPYEVKIKVIQHQFLIKILFFWLPPPLQIACSVCKESFRIGLESDFETIFYSWIENVLLEFLRLILTSFSDKKSFFFILLIQFWLGSDVCPQLSYNNPTPD